MTDKTIKQHIDDDLKELNDPLISSQRRRHVEEELECLERYHSRHPEDEKDPSALELYCDDNPDALECRMYDT